MSRTKLFLENIFIYGGVQAISKLLPFIFLPIIISYIKSPAEFGKFDMFSLLISLGSAFATLGTYDAGFRENFDKESKYGTSEIISTVGVITLISSLVISLIILLFRRPISNLFWNEEFNIFIYLAIGGIILHAFQNVLIMPLRLKNDRKKYSFYLIGNSLLYYVFTIILLNFRPTALALMLSMLITSLLLVLNLYFANREYLNYKFFSVDLAISLLKVGLPLVPVFLSMWILQAIGRILITSHLGMESQGIYAVANKVATVSSIIQIAFTSGFSFFSFSTMNHSDQVFNRTLLLKYLLLFSAIFVLIIVLFKDLIFSYLFPSSFLLAVQIFPFLLFLPLLFIMYQTISNQFTIAKKTYITLIILLFSVISTYILNVLFIKYFGLMGAAYSTLLGYFIMVIVSYLFAIKLNLILIDENIITLILLILVYFTLNFINIENVYIITIAFLIIIILIFRKLIFEIYNKLKFSIIRKK